MALPKAVKKEEFEKTVPELAREHYSLDEGTGEYQLGLVAKGELSQFRDNNITLQKQLKDLTTKFEGIDPEEHKKMATRIKELEKGNGHVDVEKELETRTANMKKAHAEELAKLTDSNKSLSTRLTNVLVNQRLSELALAKEVVAQG